jgi:hypothetical protein
VQQAIQNYPAIFLFCYEGQDQQKFNAAEPQIVPFENTEFILQKEVFYEDVFQYTPWLFLNKRPIIIVIKTAGPLFYKVKSVYESIQTYVAPNKKTSTLYHQYIMQ